MKHTTRILCALTALMLAASLGACGGNAAPAGSAGESAAEPASSLNEANQAPEITDGPAEGYFDSAGNMNLPLVAEPTSFRVMWSKQAHDKGGIEDKEILTKAFEETGISWEVEEVSETGWPEKVSVVFAANDLPDLFCGKIDNLINFTDQCVDVTDLLPIYAPYMAEFYFNQYPEIFKAEAFQGRMYSLPQVRVNNINYFGGWDINTRWLENVGLEMPETIDEFYEVLKAFKEQDANGNGDPTDEIPYSFVKLDKRDGNGERGLLQWVNAFGLVNDGANKQEHYIMVEEGKVSFIPSDDRFLDMLQFLHKLYAEGLMDKDGFVQEITDQYAKCSSDRVGFATCGGLLTELWGGEIAADIEYLLPPLTEHGRKLSQNEPPAELNLHVYTITKACENPELLLLFQEYCNSGFDNRVLSLFGPEGGAWVWDDEEKMVNNADFEGKAFTTVQQARATLAPNYRMASIMEEGDEGRRSYVGFSLKYNTSHKEFYGPEGGAAHSENFPLGNDTAENTATRTEMFAEIDSYIQNFVAEAVMNGIDEAKWDTHQKTCERLNIEQFVADYQRLYEELMSL